MYPHILPNTTLLYYGRAPQVGMNLVEEGYLDFSAKARHAYAGFASSYTITDYAKIQVGNKRIFFDISPIEGEQPRIPGFFQMLGGSAFGSTALVEIIRYYGWKRVVLYFQTDPGNERTREMFASSASAAGIQLEQQLRESKGRTAAQDDFEILSKAESNVFIFLGGLLCDNDSKIVPAS